MISVDKNILFIGPLPPPVNGQSVCFELLLQNYSGSKFASRNVEQLGLFRKFGVFSKALIGSFFYLLFFKIDCVYISISRSWPGIIFDSLIIFISKILKKRIILHLHGNDFFISNFQKNVFSPLYSKVDFFVVLSQPMKDYVMSFLSCPIIVILNPIQDFFFKEYVSSKKEDNLIRIVFFSNIMKSKGIFEFINIAKFFNEIEMDRQTEFHIIGRLGADHEMSLDEISSAFLLNISNVENLFYHGSLYGADLSCLLSDMDVLIFPSYYPVEALPLSILECAAKGLYLIINRHNDLTVFEDLLPEVSIINTSDPKLVFDLICGVDKSQIKCKGLLNKTKAIDYSLDAHLNRFRDIL